MMGVWGALTSTCVAVVLIASGSALSATPSPCGASFIDVDNDGVCSPGDVPLAAVLEGMDVAGAQRTIDVTRTITAPDGTVVYEPPGDGHPVGLVFGGTLIVGVEGAFDAFATGSLSLDGRLYANAVAVLSVRSCRSIRFGPHSLLQEQGGLTAEIALTATADQCADATVPATLDVGRGARLETQTYLTLTGDRVHLDDRAQLRTFAPVRGATPGFLKIYSGDLSLGRHVVVNGPPESEIDIDNCGPTMSADRLAVRIGVLDLEDGNAVGLCDRMFTDGTLYNASAFPQRLTLTNSTVLNTLDQGIARTNPRDDGTYPCDAITLIHSGFGPFGTMYFDPVPRIDPTGPCTGDAEPN